MSATNKIVRSCSVLIGSWSWLAAVVGAPLLTMILVLGYNSPVWLLGTAPQGAGASYNPPTQASQAQQASHQQTGNTTPPAQTQAAAGQQSQAPGPGPSSAGNAPQLVTMPIISSAGNTATTGTGAILPSVDLTGVAMPESNIPPAQRGNQAVVSETAPTIGASAGTIRPSGRLE